MRIIARVVRTAPSRNDDTTLRRAAADERRDRSAYRVRAGPARGMRAGFLNDFVFKTAFWTVCVLTLSVRVCTLKKKPIARAPGRGTCVVIIARDKP